MFYSQSSIGLEYRVWLDFFIAFHYASLLSSVILGRHCRHARKHFISFYLSHVAFAFCIYTHILWPHVSPLSLALFHSFILLLFLRFPLYFRASLSLSHSRTQPFVHAVYAQNSLFISSTIVCFSLLFSVHTTNLLFIHDIDIDMYTNANITFYIRNCE